MVYLATDLHYFDQHIDEVEKLMESVRIADA